MDKEFFPKGWKVYLPLIIVYVVLLFFFPNVGKFKYHYQLGRPWMYETLISPIDFPILKTESELLEEKEARSSSVIPYFRLDENIKNEVDRSLSSLEISGDSSSVSQDFIMSLFDTVYDYGVVSLLSEQEIENGIVFVQKNRRAAEVPVENIFDISHAESYIRDRIAAETGKSQADSLYEALSLSQYLKPNLIFDQATTDMIHKEATDYVSPTKGIIYTGQLIVSNGEIITAEIEQLLDSYKAEYLSSMGISGSTALIAIGNALLLLFTLMSFYAAILFVDKGVFKDGRKYLFLLTLYAISTLIIELVGNMEDASYMFLVPFPLFALYMLAFFKRRFVFPIYTVILSPLLVVAQEGTELFFMNMLAGIVAIISYTRFNRGWLQFVNALFIFLTLTLSYTAFVMLQNEDLSRYGDYGDVFYLGLASLFCVAGYPLVFLFERVFMLVSNSRLVELADTNNRLLRLMAEKAPGTFQHVLQVMNISDACARAIGAEVQLVRTGSLYHDIGKTANPQCFVENAVPGVNYHEGLSPEESARDIIKHVDDGVALAKKYKIPQVVVDFILSHHGTTRTEYFYNVFVNNGGDPERVSEFQYHGFKPKTKEQVIVMFADTVEAASRSLKNYSEQSVRELVDNVVKMKIDDGQLLDADISLKEISVLKSVLVEYLMQINHARIAYPKRQQK